MGQGRYVFDTAAEGEGDRLETLQQAFDEATFRHLTGLGVGPGWTCLEVAGGKGSVAEWLCRQVGDSGRVVATDLSTLYLDKIDAPNLEVRRHDIVNDELETGAFDVVHCRFLLEHIPEREPVLAKLVSALAPGGWLLVEDADLSWLGTGHGRGRFVIPVALAALVIAVRRHGHDRRMGGRLPGLFHAHGLTEIGGEGRNVLLIGGPETAAWLQPSLARLRQMLRAGTFGDNVADPGRLASACARWPAVGAWVGRRLDQVEATAADPEFSYLSPSIVSAWGRKPA